MASSLPGYWRFRRALSRPAETQHRLLRTLVSRHAESDFGRAHGFAGISCYEEFSRQVPLAEYAEMEPWIARIRSGEPRVLTADEVDRLVPTSGSVGARKLIPFTGGLQAAFNRAIEPWITDLFLAQRDLMRGSAYWSITPLESGTGQEQEQEHSAVPIGFDDDSRYLGGVRQRLVASIMAAPSLLRWVPDLHDFVYLTCFFLLSRPDLRLISVWHPSFLALLLDALPRWWHALIEDLEKGAPARIERFPPALRSRCALSLTPMRRRAAELRRLNPEDPVSVWPHLKLISCWQDAHAEPAARMLGGRFPGVTMQAKGLLATEAFVTIPFAARHPVAVRSHFFEFIDEAGKCRRVHELREGESYEVVVSNGGGLWRYLLHDRVRVNGFVEQTPSLRFLGKGDNVSDRVGEKLSEAFVGQVLREISAGLPEPPRFAMLAPEVETESSSSSGNSVGRYVLYLEGPSREDLGVKVDAGLRRNPQYDWSRSLGQLGEVSVMLITAGYESFVAREMQQGRRLGEIKPIALSPRTGWSEWFRRPP